MNDRYQEHPNRGMLVDFGLGKLSTDEVAAVESHLAECPECCETLQNLQGDTFIELVRRHGAAEFGSQPETTGLAPSRVAETGADGGATDDLPPELKNHPRYQIIRLLGRGGMGVVFAAEHRLMNRQVALKIIRPNLISKPVAVARFRREVQAAAKLSHPNIVAAYDAEQAGKFHFLVMEYVEGTALSQVVETEGPLRVGAACDYVRQMAEALEHAHQAEMVHRDIKPHNVIVDRKGQVKILDFGLATLVEAPLDATDIGDAEPQSGPSAPFEGSTRKSLARMTEQGAVMGTPDYVAPEQIVDASSADIRSDIYSLGCTLFYLLSGRPPFAEGSTQEKLRAHVQDVPPSLTELNRDVPPQLDDIVNRMLAKAPETRHQTPAEVAAALMPFTQSAATRSDGAGLMHRIIALVAAAFIFFGTVAVIYVKTDEGALELRTSDPNIQLVLSQNGRQVKVIDSQSGSSVERLPSGRYNVELCGPDEMKLTMLSKPRGAADFGDPLDYARDGFTLSRGEFVLARVERRAKAASGDTGLIHVSLQGHEGTEILGVVEPATDRFTITTWNNDSGKSWTPRESQLPLELAAFAADGRPFDLPWDWDGSLTGFAFLLPIGQDVTGIDWIERQEGEAADPWKGSSFGWGGLRNSAGRIVVRGTHRFSYVPSAPDRLSEINLDRVTLERVSTSGEPTRQTILPPRREQEAATQRSDLPTVRLRLDVQPAHAISIALHNSGFEEQVLPDGDRVVGTIPHWSVDADEFGEAGAQNPLNEDFAGATAGEEATTIPDGDNVAFCGGTGRVGSSAISQVLSNRLEANMHYFLQVAVGRRKDGDWPKYKVQLRAGDAVLAEDDNSLSPAPGEFLTSIVNHITRADDAQLGQPLEVRLLAYDARDPSGSAQVQFDRVQMYSRPADSAESEPSISLYWFGPAGIRGWVVERGHARRTGPFQSIAALEGDTTSCIDDDPALEPGTTYYYRVLSRESRSVRSGPVGVTTLSQDVPARE